MAQELVNNIVKHAAATQAQLSLHAQHGYLVLQAQDNGRGFDAEQPVADGLGLSVLRDRARLLNGTLHIASAAQHGTTITVSLPLAAGTVAAPATPTPHPMA